MDSDFIQHFRYKLQKRLKRLNTADFQGFHIVLRQVWGFLEDSELTKGILDDLARRFPGCEQDADQTLKGEPQVGTTESENDAICYWVIRKCVGEGTINPIIHAGHLLARSSSKLSDYIEAFRLTYLEPLFDYVDEQLDDKRMTLALLLGGDRQILSAGLENY